MQTFKLVLLMNEFLELASDLIQASQKHEQYRDQQCINLIASEGSKSPAVKEAIRLSMDLESRYAEGENSYVMGVRASFTRKGYNRVWIYPENEIVIPGAAKKVDVWVWGANYYYNLEVHLRDYRGIVHKLPLGSLHFIGWRNLSVLIPKQIPQFIRYLPMEKPLTLVRLVIWTQPTERVDDYIIYFDHLKVLTDVYRERFDGDVLADESRTIWSSE